MLQLLKNVGYICTEVWRNVGMAQRVSMILVAVLTVGALSAIFYFGTRPNWHAVYTDLGRKKASQIYELAKSENIPVKLQDGGRTVLAPYRKVSDLRTRAASEGIKVADKGTGLELFDKQNFGMTKTQQKIGYQRAMQGELERMIRKMQGIENVRVLLAIPERDPFRTESEQQGEASVFVVRQPGYTLTGNQISSIREMVAGGIDRLEGENVTITNDKGKLLAQNGGMGAGGGIVQQLDIKNNIENFLKDKVESVMQPIVGLDGVRTSVSVLLDWDRGTTTTESYKEGDSAVKQETKRSQNSQNTGGAQSKSAGSSSNVVSISEPGEDDKNSSLNTTSEETTERQYLVPKVTEVTEKKGVRLSNISVAVIIDKKESGDARSSEEMEGYKELVASAVSGTIPADMNPMDHITLVEEDFAKPEKIETASKPFYAPENLKQYADGVGYDRIFGIAGGIFLLLILYRTFKRTVINQGVEQEDIPQIGMKGNVQVMGEGEDAHMTGKGQGRATTHQSFQMIEEKTKENPQMIAGAIENWLHDELNAKNR